MKILIISDIHSNYEALLAVAHAEQADEILCLGDLVDFGPQPAECVQWVRHHVRQHCVMGNHDYALAFGVDCRSSLSMHELSAITRALNLKSLHSEQVQYLQSLPAIQTFTFQGFHCHFSHAAPDGDLYKNHLRPDIGDEALAAEIENIDANFIFCGHTHLPMLRKIGGKTFANPGSVGLPLDGDPRASYAILEEGKIKLRRLKYDVGKTIDKLFESPLPTVMAARLAEILDTGRNTGGGMQRDLT